MQIQLTYACHKPLYFPPQYNYRFQILRRIKRLKCPDRRTKNTVNSSSQQQQTQYLLDDQKQFQTRQVTIDDSNQQNLDEQNIKDRDIGIKIKQSHPQVRSQDNQNMLLMDDESSVDQGYFKNIENQNLNMDDDVKIPDSRQQLISINSANLPRTRSNNNNSGIHDNNQTQTYQQQYQNWRQQNVNESDEHDDSEKSKDRTQGPNEEFHPKYLTQIIRNCTSFDQLLELIEAYSNGMDHINISQIFTQMWKVNGYERSEAPAHSASLKQLLKELTDLYLLNYSLFDPRGLSDMVKALSAVRWRPSRDWMQITKQQIFNKIEHFTAYNCALMMQGLSVLDINEELLFDLLMDRYCTEWENGISTDFCMVVGAVQRADFKPKQDQRMVLKLALKKFLVEMHPLELARASIFCISVFPEEGELNNQILNKIIQSGYQRYGPQEITSTLQAMAKMHRIEETFIVWLVNLAQDQIEQFSSQQAAYCAYALGEITKTSELQQSNFIKPLLKQFIPVILKQIETLETHVIALLPKSYVYLKIFDMQFFLTISHYINPSKIYTTQLINVFWAYGVFMYRSREELNIQLIDKIVQQLKFRKRKLKVEQMASCLWTMAKIRYRDVEFLNFCADNIIKHQEQYNLVAQITVQNSFAALSFNRQDFNILVVQTLLKGVKPNPRDVCNVMKNVCILDIQQSQENFQAKNSYDNQILEQNLQKQVYVPIAISENRQIGPQQENYNLDIQGNNIQNNVENSQNSVQCQPLFKTYILQFIQILQNAEFLQDEDLRQIYECYLMSSTNERDWWEQLPPNFQSACRLTYEKYLQYQQVERRSVGLSAFGEEVLSILQGGVINNECQVYEILQNQLIGEIVVRAEDQFLVIEADGPIRFCKQYPYIPTSQMVVRNQIVKNLGFPFVSIPFYKWYELESKKQKQEYLRELLSQFQ